MIFTFLLRSGSQSPGNGAVSSRVTWKRSAAGVNAVADAEAVSGIPSGISTLLRQIHPRESPEMRTWTQSALKSSISNSSCWDAINCGLAVRLGVATTGVPDFLTATRFLG